MDNRRNNDDHADLADQCGGQPLGWIGCQEAVLHYAKDQVAWTLGEQPARVHGGLNRVRQTRSYVDVHPIVAVKQQMSRDAIAGVPPLTNRELFGRDRHTCMYCLTSLPERQLARDHVVPLSRGGQNVRTNVVTACRACNQRKADRLLEHTGMRLQAVPYGPSRAQWLILRNRHILADQMAFLKAQ